MKQLSQSSFVLFTSPIQIYTRLSSLLLLLLLLSELSPSLAGTLILPDYINGMRVSLHRYRNNCPDFYSCSANATTTDLCCVPKYGLLQLVLRWDTTLGPINNFTIHGFHPTGCNGERAPENGCDSERQYKNAGKIVKSNDQDLYNKMTTYWPSNKGTDSGFWTHEWNKHGTCVSTLSPKCYGKDYKANKDMIDYFSDAITLRSKYDVYDAFAKAGIKPGDQTNSDQFTSAFNKQFGRSLTLRCASGKITEAMLYFTVSGRNYELTDPPRSGNSGCGGQILWPAKTTKNSTDGNNDNNGNNGSDKTASSIGGVSAVAFVIAVLTLFV